MRCGGIRVDDWAERESMIAYCEIHMDSFDTDGGCRECIREEGADLEADRRLDEGRISRAEDVRERKGDR